VTTSARPVTATQNANDVGTLDYCLRVFERILRRQNKAPNTIRNYMGSGRALSVFLREQGMPTLVESITREHIEAYFDSLYERNLQPSSIAKHYRDLRQIFRFLVEDDEIPTSPMAKIKAPAVPDKPVPLVADDVLDKLLASLRGKRDFMARRDYALIHMLRATGTRRSEIMGVTMDAIDHDHMVIHVMGKGRKERPVPYDSVAADALRYYLRARRTHPLAGESALWLGHRRPLTGQGLDLMIKRRLKAAGLPALHPHQFRHTLAHKWLINGGQEGDLMKLTGWTTRAMVQKYGAVAATDRMVAAYREMEKRTRR